MLYAIDIKSFINRHVFYTVMAFPLVAGALGLSTVIGGHITRQVAMSGLRQGLTQFGTALPFGAGYSFGTYVGFPKNYSSQSKNTTHVYKLTMPFGYYRRRRFRRYGYRRYRPWYRRY